MSESELEPNELVVARVSEVLALAQSGALTGVICICFMANGQLNVQVAGNESLVVRLGAINIAADAMKLFETQKQAAAQQQVAQWGPGGNA